MISAWYFCASIKADPRQASAWLAVLDTLEAGDSDARMAIACAQLDDCDVWQQAYALPYVLRAIRDRAQDSVAKRAARAFVTDLIGSLPDSVAPPFRSLAEAFFDARGMQQVLDAARAMLKPIESMPMREPSQRPYVDLQRFLPEAVLLALLGEIARRESRDLGAQGNDDPFAAFTDRALTHAFGRLPFLLAVDLELERRRLPPEQLEQRIWGAPRSDPKNEPDLLDADARVLWAQRAQEPGRTIDFLIDESILLGRLCAHLVEQERRKERPGTARPDLVPLVQSDLGRFLLPVIAWQLALWDLAVRLDPAAAMRRLAVLWGWEPVAPLAVIDLRGPLGRTTEAWRRCASGLLALRGRDLQIRICEREQFSLPPSAQWVLFSPWVPLDPSLRPTHSDVQRYPRPLDDAQVIRLFGATVLAVRLLRTLPDDAEPTDDPRQATVPALLVHATDVLAMYDRFLRGQHESNVAKCLAEPQTILALYAARQCKHAGAAHWDRIGPERFTRIFDIARDLRRLAPDVQVFVDEVLPRTLMNFLADGYNTAIDDSGPSRWWPHLFSIYERYRRPHLPWTFHDIRTQLQSTLVVRFLGRDKGGGDIWLPRLDWTKTLARKGWRGVQPRQLLLGPPRPADAWLPAGWPEPDPDASGASTRLIRAVERFAALANPGSLPAEVQQEWKKELADALDSIPRSHDLDRFLRLRLLEVLDLPLIAGDAPGQLRIALLLLEYGSPFDRQQLLARLFPPGDNAWNAAVPDARRTVRVSFLRALLGVLAHPPERDDRGQKAERDPIDLGIEASNRASLREAVRRIAVRVNPSREPGDKELLAVLRRQAGREVTRDSEETRLVSAQVQVLDHHEHLMLDGNTDLPDWQITFAVRDPNLPHAVLIIDQPDLATCKNLFDLTADELAELSPTKLDALEVLGIVVGVRWQSEYVVNCGLDEYIFARSMNPNLAPGTPVSVHLRPKGEGKPLWRHDEQFPLTPLHPRWMPYVWRRVEVRAEQEWHGVTVAVQGVSKFGVVDTRTDWDSDLSRQFAADRASTTIGYARFQDPHWLPVDRDFDQLLAAEWTQSDGQFAVLCFLARGSGGEGFRFQRRAGENYLLSDDDFTDAAREQIEDQVRRPGARGLLVTVTTATSEDRVRLTLTEAGTTLSDEHATRRYASLRCPFDLRNLEWRILPTLTGGEPALAEKDARWRIEVDPKVPGYPDYVDVTWVNHSPGRDEDQAMVTVVAWGAAEQAAAQVKAEAVHVLRVEYRGEEMESFYDRWISLRLGDRLRLKDVLGRLNPDGQFLARTHQGLRVYVEGESLTMRFIGDAFRLPASRECEVVRMRPWAPLEAPAPVDEALLPEPLRGAVEARGIFVRVPHVRSRKRLCTILWNVGDDYFEHEIILEKLPHRLEQGMVAHLWRAGSLGLQLQVESRALTVRGLWALHEVDGLTADATYLGRAGFGGEGIHVAEGRAGELLHLRRASPYWRHLAESDGTDCKGGLDPNLSSSVTANSGSGFAWSTRERRLCRAHLAFPFHEGVLVGTCDADGPQIRVIPQRVILTLQRAAEQPGDGGPLYRLQRHFELIEHRPERPPGSRENKEKEKPSSAEIHQSLIDAYFIATRPAPLDAVLRSAVIDEGRTIRQVEIKPQGGKNYFFPASDNRWIPRLDLGPNEDPWIGGASYAPDNCRVILKRTDAGLAASFRDVPALGVAEFRREVANSVPHSERITLRFRLYYVGREKPTGAAGDTDPWWHRFEWGCGYTLFVSERELLWNGDAFARAALVLFHGDSIRAVMFVPAARATPASGAPSADEEGAPAQVCLLSIEGADIQFSDARTLYDQRRRHKIVHLLKLSRRGAPDGKSTPEISHVLGFDANAAVDSERRFQLGRPVQIEDIGGLEDVTDEAYVLARLDEQAYEDSLGRTLSFRRVAMELTGINAGGLDPGELVFMQAGETEPKSNDIGLRLLHVDGFVGRVGPELNGLLLLRRNFSCRQDLLGRIHDAGLTAQELTTRYLLVKLSTDGSRVVADLIDRMPPRRRTVLLQGAGRERMLLATVADFLPNAAEPELLRLELRPGVFVEIPVAETDLLDQVTPGDIVRVEIAGARFQVARAASGDESFVPPEGRPAVALPKNRLLRKRLLDEGTYQANGFWMGRSYFSIGGLPNVEPIAGGWDARGRRWRSLFAADAIRLMETPHPRLGTLMRDENDEHRVWLWPRVEDAAAGKLEIDNLTRQLTLKPIAAPFDDAAPPPLAIPWTQASFADESIAEISARVERHRFGYHDTTSGHWVPRDKAGAAAANGLPSHALREYELEPHSPLTGPIFAEVSRGAARLRYAPESFVRFGFPVSELLAVFHEKRRRMSFTVAGVSARGGLWLELAPGRVAELPAQLVVRRLRGEERSLALLHWSAFAPGDRVTLELASSDPLTIDRLALVDWQPSVRGSFGCSTAILPVAQPHDAKAGSLVAGAGSCTLRIPFAGILAPKRIAISPDNTCADAERFPLPGETVLLVNSESVRPSVAGYPELRPVPNRVFEAGFAGDPMGKLLTGTELSMRQAIEAAGGAIPVTVGAVIAQERLLSFHRQHQIAACQLPAGALGLARVLGRIEQSLLLRWGGGVLIADIGEVVSGVPGHFHAVVGDALRDARTEIWIRRLTDGRLLYRADAGEPMHEIVAVTAVVVEALARDGSKACSLVCRDAASGALYWLPAAQAAWTELTRDELAFLFERESFPAQIVRDARGEGAPYLSVVQMQTVQREFRHLKLGAELSVRVERRRQRAPGDPLACLVTTASSRVALSLEEPIADDRLGAEIKVEVLRREERPPRLDVVLPGHKTFHLDLPSALLQEIAQPDAALAAFEASGLAVECDDASVLAIDPRSVPGRPAEELDRLLAAVYWHAEGRDLLALDALPLCSVVAREWHKARGRDRELSVAHALMAILLFDRVGAAGGDRTAREDLVPELRDRDVASLLSRTFQKTINDAAALRDEHLHTSVDLALNVGRRAVRSRHVELLASAWLFYEESAQLRRRARRDDLWGRLRKIAPLIGGDMTAEDLERVRSMCAAIELRDLAEDRRGPAPNAEFPDVWHSGLPAVAAALRASLGEARGVNVLFSGAPITSQLAAMLRSLPLRRNGKTMRLDRRQLAEMRRMLDAIRSRGWNLHLLEPLPRPLLDRIEAKTDNRQSPAKLAPIDVQR